MSEQDQNSSTQPAEDPAPALSTQDKTSLQFAKKDLQIAQLQFKLFLVELYRNYGLKDSDMIDDNGNIVRNSK